MSVIPTETMHSRVKRCAMEESLSSEPVCGGQGTFGRRGRLCRGALELPAAGAHLRLVAVGKDLPDAAAALLIKIGLAAGGPPEGPDCCILTISAP